MHRPSKNRQQPKNVINLTQQHRDNYKICAIARAMQEILDDGAHRVTADELREAGFSTEDIRKYGSEAKSLVVFNQFLVGV